MHPTPNVSLEDPVEIGWSYRKRHTGAHNIQSSLTLRVKDSTLVLLILAIRSKRVLTFGPLDDMILVCGGLTGGETAGKMNVQFANDTLERLDAETDFNANYSVEIVRGFRKLMRIIRAALDERDFRAMRSLHFERLKGARSHEYSLRINKQWRLIIEIEKAEPKNTIIVVAIEDYH